jgi:hypothetical protein
MSPTSASVEQRIRAWAQRFRSPNEETLFLQNIPGTAEKDMMMDWIDSMGFKGKYDFLYLPRCFTTRKCKGYAFINFVDPESARKFTRELDGFTFTTNSRFKITRSLTQGLEENTAMWAHTRLFRVQDPEMLPFVRYLHDMGIRHLGHLGDLAQPDEVEVPMTKLFSSEVTGTSYAGAPQVKWQSKAHLSDVRTTADARWLSEGDAPTYHPAGHGKGRTSTQSDAMTWLDRGLCTYGADRGGVYQPREKISNAQGVWDVQAPVSAWGMRGAPGLFCQRLDVQSMQ